jgi:hypothetical protein
MHTPGWKARGHGRSGKMLWEGERNRWKISKGVVAKSSKNVIKLSTYCSHARKITSKILALSTEKNIIFVKLLSN